MSQPSVPAPPQPWRTVVTAMVFGALFVLLGFKLHEIQVEQADRFMQLGENQRSRVWTLSAPRGAILDAEGTPLAVSGGVWQCFADPDWMSDKLTAITQLPAILHVPRDQLEAHFESGRNGRLLADDLTDAQADAVRALDLPGIHLRRAYARDYPAGYLASHSLGFVLADGSGGAGIEQAYQTQLAGQAGRQEVQLDARGRPFIDETCERTPAVPGADVSLTLVLPIQAELEAALAEAVERHQATSAAAIVVRPTTGEIVAMASWPTFDPADFGDAVADQFRNNVLAFVYESGSTMKPLIAGAAVAEGLFNWQQEIFCEDGRWTHRVGRARRTIHDHSFKYGGHQDLTVAEIVAKSDNIGMAKMGIALGPQRLYDWVQQYGFGRRSGIELPGENVGIVLPRRRWNELGSCMSVPMGHEIAVTPLQMAMAHAAVANEGLWLPPRVVRRVSRRDPLSGAVQQVETEPRPQPRRILSARDARAIEAAMRLTMTDGTGKRLQLSRWTSAGKTGTTEKLINGRYADDRHIGSFVCWAPADPDRLPELVALVVVDDPRENGHYGGQTGGPVVQRVLEFGLNHLGVPPSPGHNPPESP